MVDAASLAADAANSALERGGNPAVVGDLIVSIQPQGQAAVATNVGPTLGPQGDSAYEVWKAAQPANAPTTVADFFQSLSLHVRGPAPATAPTTPAAGDVYLISATVDASSWAAGLTTASAGNGVVYDGTTWHDMGPLRGPAGPGRTVTAGTTGQDETDAPASPEVGDVFFIAADQKAWMYDGGTWQQIQAPAPALPDTPTIIVAADAGDVPVAAGAATASGNVTMPDPLVDGTLFINTADGLVQVLVGGTWTDLPDDLPTLGTAGQVLAVNAAASGTEYVDLPELPVVTVSATKNEAPANAVTGTNYGWTATDQPKVGDLFVNTADGLVWVCTVAAAAAGDSGTWTMAGSPAQELPQVVVSALTGEVPTSGTGATAVSNAGTVAEGWVFLNTVDHRVWFYDGADWKEVGSFSTSVTSTAIANEVPANPSGTAKPPTVLTTVTGWATKNHQPGDIFINTNSGQVWMYDGANWIDFPAGTVVSSNTPGESPTAPGGATMPNPIPAGTVFVNANDRVTWIYDGAAWLQTSFAPNNATVTVNANPGKTPTTNPPASPTDGDAFINTADGLTWLYGGRAWQAVVTAPPAPDDVIVVAGDGTDGEAGHVYFTYDSTLGAVDATAGTGNVGTDPRTEYVDAGLVSAPVTLPQVYLDATTGNDPAAATAAGKVLDPATVALVEGDVFINTADGLTWIHDGTNWQPVNTRHSLTYFGNAGAGAPSAAVVPTGAGDLYLDKTAAAAGGASIYEADAAGTAWQAAPSITMLPGDQFFDIPNTDVYREV